MTRKIREFFKFIAVLLVIVAIFGFLGSTFRDKDDDDASSEPEESSQVETVRPNDPEETTEPHNTPNVDENEVVDHTNCRNEFNWSVIKERDDDGSLDICYYICNICNSKICDSYTGILSLIYDCVDLSTGHKFDHASNIMTHSNYIVESAAGPNAIYISSKSTGSKITTSFKDCEVDYRGKYMVIAYRVLDDLPGDLTLTLNINGEETVTTVSEPFTDGWRSLAFDISSYEGYNASGSNTIGVSFTHYATLDVGFVGWSNNREACRYCPFSSYPFYDNAIDFANPGYPNYAE